MMVTITSITARMGAENTGLDLSQPLSDEQIVKIKMTLHERALLFVRDQRDTTPEQHIAFSRRFGDLEVHV